MRGANTFTFAAASPGALRSVDRFEAVGGAGRGLGVSCVFFCGGE